jgi:hypothetical protein|tara:strand:- start:2053 stop:2451 length:399 start_codon:yes stop_codon:yes gene_type:complete
MIKYNWEKINREAKGDSVSILTIIHLLTYKRIPASRKDKTYKYFGKSFLGQSFLLNPRQLLAERRYYSNKEAAEYVAVASYRNYFDYKRTGQTTLELIHLPVNETIVNRNRLLRIENGLVHFLFEDNANWRT